MGSAHVSVVGGAFEPLASERVSFSDSSDSSSSSSDESPARSVQSAAVPAPPSLPPPALDKDEPRKSFGIKVQNLPVRSTGEDAAPVAPGHPYGADQLEEAC